MSPCSVFVAPHSLTGRFWTDVTSCEARILPIFPGVFFKPSPRREGCRTQGVSHPVVALKNCLPGSSFSLSILAQQPLARSARRRRKPPTQRPSTQAPQREHQGMQMMSSTLEARPYPALPVGVSLAPSSVATPRLSARPQTPASPLPHQTHHFGFGWGDSPTRLSSRPDSAMRVHHAELTPAMHEFLSPSQRLHGNVLDAGVSGDSRPRSSRKAVARSAVRAHDSHFLSWPGSAM
jgi:hypothetical protein